MGSWRPNSAQGDGRVPAHLRGDAVRSLSEHSSVNTEPLRVFPALTLPSYRNVGVSSLQ